MRKARVRQEEYFKFIYRAVQGEVDGVAIINYGQPDAYLTLYTASENGDVEDAEHLSMSE